MLFVAGDGPPDYDPNFTFKQALELVALRNKKKKLLRVLLSQNGFRENMQKIFVENERKAVSRISR